MAKAKITDPRKAYPDLAPDKDYPPLHIPYKGSGQALPDLMSGRVQMMFENAPGAVSHIKSGKVRALAVIERLNRDLNAVRANNIVVN